MLIQNLQHDSAVSFLKCQFPKSSQCPNIARGDTLAMMWVENLQALTDIFEKGFDDLVKMTNYFPFFEKLRI